jgi:hypothetical protein
MPKNPFNFEVTGRELFDSERGAVDDFVRRYVSSSSLEGAPSAEVTHVRGTVKPAGTSKSATSVSKRIATLKKFKSKRAAKKTVTLSSKAAKAVIFGLAPQAPVKTRVARPQSVMKAGAKPAAAKRSTARAA